MSLSLPVKNLLLFLALSVLPPVVVDSVGGVEDSGEIKPEVITRAAIANQTTDYEISITSSPRLEALPGQEISYTVTYGCSGGNETSELELVVDWSLPKGKVVRYVVGSATSGHEGVIPKVEPGRGRITWSFLDFPPGVVSQQVFFKLRAEEKYKEAGTFPVEVKARLLAPPISLESSSRITVTYPGRGPAIPLTVWYYLKELLSQPSFQFLVSRLSLLFLLLVALTAFLVLIVKFDIGLLSLHYLLIYIWICLLSFLGLKKRRVVWGRVYDERLRGPIFLAKVFVYNFSGRLLGSCLTDREGRFGFDFPHGRYLLRVRKGGFSVSSSREFLMLSGSDLTFNWQREVAGEIFLRKASFWRGKFESLVEGMFFEFSDFIFVFGILLSAINCFLLPSFKNWIILFCYLLFLSIWTNFVFR